MPAVIKKPRGNPRRKVAGFTYLWLLLVVAIAGASLAITGQWWTTVAQRDREFELEFRGRQIVKAIASYCAGSPGAVKHYPNSLDDLVDDRRGPQVVHHLRRAYADPLTGQADWVLVPTDSSNPALGFRGVRSRAQIPALRTAGQTASVPSADVLVSDREFVASCGALPPPVPVDAGNGPTRRQIEFAN